MLVAGTGAADSDLPDRKTAVKKKLAEQQKQCDKGNAVACIALGNLAASDYTVLANGYHHDRDLADGADLGLELDHRRGGRRSRDRRDRASPSFVMTNAGAASARTVSRTTSS